MTENFTMQVPGNPFHSPVGHQAMSSHEAISSTSTTDLNGRGQGIFNMTKRRRVEEESMEGSPLRQCQCGNTAEFTAYRGRRFVPLSGCDKVFHSESVKTNQGDTMYLPLLEDILINMNNIEQVSFADGVFFVGDHRGNYVRSEHGHVINLWRFDSPTRNLYISRSLLFLEVMMFNEVKGMLQCM